ncbi:MAG: thioredoxin family protein [Porcipelethomonas sp.]
MALFGFGKKKAESKTSCCCGKNRNDSVVNTNTDGEMISIKVLGAGCKSCHQQYENAKEAVKEMGLSVEVEYITDMEKVMSYGVMSMPAVVVNEKVAAMGKVLKTADVVKILRKSGV